MVTLIRRGRGDRGRPKRPRARSPIRALENPPVEIGAEWHTAPLTTDWPPRPIRVSSSVPAERFPPLVPVAPDCIALAKTGEMR
jgi:hypothetical protein